MKTLQEVTDAVDQGIVVYWKNKAYKVENGPLGYDVVCTLNGHADGLNEFYSPEDFFTFSEAMEYQA